MASWPNSTDASLEVASDSFSWSLQALHCFEQKNQALVDYTKIIAWALIFVIPPYLMAGDQQSLTKVSPNLYVPLCLSTACLAFLWYATGYFEKKKKTRRAMLYLPQLISLYVAVSWPCSLQPISFTFWSR